MSDSPMNTYGIRFGINRGRINQKYGSVSEEAIIPAKIISEVLFFLYILCASKSTTGVSERSVISSENKKVCSYVIVSNHS